MVRFLVFGFCGLGSFGFLVTTLLLVTGALGNPIQLPYAVLASIMIAPLLGWRLGKIALSQLQAAFESGGYRVARLPGPAIGLTIQRLATLSPADLSVLVMALRHEGTDEAFMGTSAGSPNYELWRVLAHLGLMGEIRAEPELTAASQAHVRKFYITPNGKQLIPPLLNAASVISSTMPEMAEGFDSKS